MASNTSNYLDEYLKVYEIPDTELINIKNTLTLALKCGLEKNVDKFYYSPLKMLPTYVTCVPDGSEYGCFVGIDLGGTNFRVLKIFVVEGKLFPMSILNIVPEDVMKGDQEDLFDFIACCIYEAFKKFDILDQKISFLGFSFSFPVNQKSLNSGYLLRWTKGYSTSNVVERDIVKLLRKACERKKLNINDFVLINDTTGTLLCGAFEDKRIKVGIIVGTGTNACYLEELKNVKNYSIITSHHNVIINTEWGAFGENGGLIDVQTEIDIKLDDDSINKGKQLFEKMISGMYLGELARLTILDLHQKFTIFKNAIDDNFFCKYSLPTDLMSYSCEKNKFEGAFFSRFNYTLDDEEAEIIRKIFDKIIKRSAYLIAAGILAIAEKINDPKCYIAVDGSLIKKHPKYIMYVNEALVKIKPDFNCHISVIDDGSGKGAALAACVATFTLNGRDYSSS